METVPVIEKQLYLKLFFHAALGLGTDSYCFHLFSPDRHVYNPLPGAYRKEKEGFVTLSNIVIARF
jgi:hypothetical protein